MPRCAEALFWLPAWIRSGVDLATTIRPLFAFLPYIITVMRTFIAVFSVSLTASALSVSCFREDPMLAALPTEICVKTVHHMQPVPDAVVYVKFNADTFPGYDKPAHFFDAVFYTGKNAHGCLRSVPEGRHWLVAFGYDSLYYPHDVWGSLRVDISLGHRPKIDTLLYVSEEH